MSFSGKCLNPFEQDCSLQVNLMQEVFSNPSGIYHFLMIFSPWASTATSFSSNKENMNMVYCSAGI